MIMLNAAGQSLAQRTDRVCGHSAGMNPIVDPTCRTAQVVNRMIREAVTGIAMHKNGLTQPGYLSPLTAART